jgi:hypothetical protein
LPCWEIPATCLLPPNIQTNCKKKKYPLLQPSVRTSYKRENMLLWQNASNYNKY